MTDLDADLGAMVTPSYTVKVAPIVFLQHVILEKGILADYITCDIYPDIVVRFQLMALPNIPLAPPTESSVQEVIMHKKTKLNYLWNSQRLFFPISIANLPYTSYLRIVLSATNTVLGSTDINLYDEHFALRCIIHTCSIEPVIFSESPIRKQLPNIELSFEFAILQPEDRSRTIANTICYASEGLFRKISPGSITTTADAHVNSVSIGAHMSLAEMNALLSPTVTPEMDLILAHKIAEHYHRIAIKESQYLNRPKVLTQLTSSLFNQEAVAVSKYAAVTVQNYIPSMPFLDTEDVLLGITKCQEAGVSCTSSILKTTAGRNLLEVDIQGMEHTTALCTNAETLEHLRNIIANAFIKYQAASAPATSTTPNLVSVHAQEASAQFSTLSYSTSATTTIDSIKLNLFNPTDYALALNCNLVKNQEIRNQNDYLLTTIAPQYDMDPTIMVPDNITARALSDLCDVLFTHPLKEQDRALLWKYRYYLRKYPRGIIKFLNSIPDNYKKALTKKKPSVPRETSHSDDMNSTDPSSNTTSELNFIVEELHTLLYSWQDPAIDQILLLLSHEYSTYNLNTGVIREYAINKLNQFSDVVLTQFLFELTFKISLDERACIVNLFNYHELYQTIEEYKEYSKKDSLAKAEQALLHITPIEPKLFNHPKSINNDSTNSQGSITLSSTSLDKKQDSPSLTSKLSIPSTSSVSSLANAGSILNSTSNLTTQLNGQHSFSVESRQFLHSQQILPRTISKKVQENEDTETPALFTTKLNLLTDALLGTVDDSLSNSSDVEPTILFGNHDDQGISDENRHILAGYSQDSSLDNSTTEVTRKVDPQRYLAFKNLSDLLVARAISAPYTYYLFYFYINLWYSDAEQRVDENARQKFLACKDSFLDIVRQKDPEFFSCLRSTILFSQQLINISMQAHKSTYKRIEQQEQLRSALRADDCIPALRRKTSLNKKICIEDDSDLGIDCDKPGIIFPFVTPKNHQETGIESHISSINLRQPTRHKRIDSLNLTNMSIELTSNMTPVEGCQVISLQSQRDMTEDGDVIEQDSALIQPIPLPPLATITADESNEKTPSNVLIVDKNEKYEDFKDRFIHICGVHSESVKVFKSKHRPILYNLIQAETGRNIPVLLKINDDVRLDMLHVQLFSLMDNYLQSHNLDMKFSTYSCFALSPTAGFVECILPSMSQDDIILDKAFNTVSNYLNGMICRHRSQVTPIVLSEAMLKLPPLLSEISSKLYSEEAALLNNIIASEFLMEEKIASFSPGTLSTLSEKMATPFIATESLPFGEISYKTTKRKPRLSNLSFNSTNQVDLPTASEEMFGPMRSTKDTIKTATINENNEGGDSHMDSQKIMRSSQSTKSHTSHTSDLGVDVDVKLDIDPEICDTEKTSVTLTTLSQSKHSKGIPSSLSMQLSTRSISKEIVQRWLSDQLVSKGVENLAPRIRTIVNESIAKIYGTGEDLMCMNRITRDIQKNNFIKSMAAYSVATYLLAVGDRHGENLLIRPDGKIFHIDFGWCFGKDPKHMAPQMKVSPVLVKVLGGEKSPGFQSYLEYVAETFCILRKDVHIVIALLYMLQGGGMEFLDKAGQSGFDVIEEKYQLSIDNVDKDAAIVYILEVVKNSMNAFSEKANDFFHRVAQSFRK